MTCPELAIRAARLVIIVVAAVLVGTGAAFTSALLGHEVLVLAYGDDLSPIDDTLVMRFAVWTDYLGGLVTALLVLVLGWRRFVRRARRPRDDD